MQGQGNFNDFIIALRNMGLITMLVPGKRPSEPAELELPLDHPVNVAAVEMLNKGPLTPDQVRTLKGMQLPRNANQVRTPPASPRDTLINSEQMLVTPHFSQLMKDHGVVSDHRGESIRFRQRA